MKYFSLIFIVLLFSCADSKDFKLSDGTVVHAEPYGWMDEEAYKHDSVVYKLSTGNIIWSIIGVETIILPIWLTGNQLYEPVRLKKSNEH